MSERPTPVIEVRDFRMAFGDQVVIDDLSFDVHAGETFGLLGSNGCGKTTTIRALLGIYQPTAGTLLVEGRRFDPALGSRLGYLPEERGLYRKESVLDVMTYFGRLKGLSHAAADGWARAYLERVGLHDHAKVRLDKLSGGQQQKVQLGVTIMNAPSILILDEPTKGFDPVNRRLLMDLVDEQRAQGSTVVMVTHQMDEVERLCDRILLLKDAAPRPTAPSPRCRTRSADAGCGSPSAACCPPRPAIGWRSASATTPSWNCPRASRSTPSSVNCSTPASSCGASPRPGSRWRRSS